MTDRALKAGRDSSNEAEGVFRSGLREEGADKEYAVLSRGALWLCQGTFRETGFAEKMQFMEALKKQLHRGVQEASFRLLKMLHAVFQDPGSERQRTGSGAIPPAFPAKILEVIREDPFPRIRIAAVQVLVCLGEPEKLGTALEDYLFGLLNQETLSACAVLNFIVDHFGREALCTVVCYLNDQDSPCPAGVLKLMEALCEEHLKRLDVKWAMMQLKKQMTRQDRNGAGQANRRYLEFMASVDRFEYARLANFQRRMDASRSDRKGAGGPAKAGRDEDARTEETDSQGSLERRLLRIRCGRGPCTHKRRVKHVTHHQGRDQDQRQRDPAGRIERARTRVRGDAHDPLRGKTRNHERGRPEEG